MAYHDFSKLVDNIEYMGKGKLNYSQFLIAAMDRKKEINEEHLWTLFKHFDLDDNGMITLEEMKYVLEKSGCNINENEADEIMEEFKSRAPNAMNYETFVDLMRCITEEHSEHESFRGSRRMSIKHHYTTVIRNRSKENVVAVNSIA
jgi:calcium-dependent protein kinase